MSGAGERVLGNGEEESKEVVAVMGAVFSDMGCQGTAFLKKWGRSREQRTKETRG